MAGRLIAQPVRCVNCRICEMICSLEKTGTFNPARARIWIRRDEKGLDAPMICRQCLAAPCEKSCPVPPPKPIRRDAETGIVRLDPADCIGCYECVQACPFGAMRIDPVDGTVFKCDLCGGNPQCAAWCPTGAVRYVNTKVLSALKVLERARTADRPEDEPADSSV